MRKLIDKYFPVQHETGVGILPITWVMALAVYLLLVVNTVSAAVPAGSYNYTRLEVAGLSDSYHVAFHPDGSYAVVMEKSNRIHIINWASRGVVSHDLTPDSGDLFWEEILFDPGGDFALIVGYHTDTTTEAVVFRLDDSLLRSGGTTAQVFSEFTSAREAGRFTAIEMPEGGGFPVVLWRNDANTIVRLRDVNPATQDFGSFNVAVNSGAACDDLAFVDNEFGEFGILVVCGTNGADHLFSTEIGGIGEWRSKPGESNTGNIPVASTHPGGDYALVVSTSARRLFRFEAGLMGSSIDAPRFATQGISHVAFAPDGQRALIVGRAGGDPLSGTVLEYRHDLYAAEEITDVSITDFHLAPYLGTSNTWLRGSVWRPGCDGGLIVGGETGGAGQLIEFSLDGGVSCVATDLVFADSFEQ